MRRLTTEEFIIKAHLIHGVKYDYGKVVYINNSTKVCIVCPEHGEFWQQPANHLQGQGCPKCGVGTAATSRKMTTEEFTERANKKHNNRYEYPDKYVRCDTKIRITCKEHGDFYQAPESHLQGQGCPDCGKIDQSLKHSLTRRKQRPPLNHIEVPKGSKAVPVGIKGDYALVDEEDYDRVMEYNWLNSGGYARNNKVGMMHRFIINTPEGMDTDHINRNRVDNRKENLRVCTRAENLRNVGSKGGISKYKGVGWSKRAGKWRSRVTNGDSEVHVGFFTDEIEAAKAYDAAAKKYHKEHAYLNFTN